MDDPIEAVKVPTFTTKELGDAVKQFRKGKAPKSKIGILFSWEPDLTTEVTTDEKFFLP